MIAVLQCIKDFEFAIILFNQSIDEVNFMAMVLYKVVPFRRSMDEYIKIFNLTNADLNKRIIWIGMGQQALTQK